MPIKLSLSSNEPLSVAADVLILGVREGAALKGGSLGELAKALGPAFGRAVKREDFTGKKDQTLELSTGGTKLRPAKVLLVGLGSGAMTEPDVRLLVARGTRWALGAKASSVAVALPEVAGAERAAAEGVVLGAYRFTKYLTGERLPKTQIERATLVLHGKITKEAREAVQLGQHVAESICIARDLINEPPNELYPEMLAKRAVEVCKERGLPVTVMDPPALEKKGMKLILAVGQGSAKGPRLVHMTYKPAVTMGGPQRSPKPPRAPSRSWSSSARGSPSTRAASASSRRLAWRR
jgi:leucyl aminopeptidase